MTNCGFLYDSNNLTYLCFHDLIETKDKNSELRKVFWNFYKKIPEYKKDKNKYYEKIVAILKKADIHGISMDSDFKENKKISIDDTFFNYYSERFNFNFNIVKNTNNYFQKMNLVFSLYSLECYEEAFKIIKLELINCKLNKTYDKMIICMINYNIILWQLKYNFSSGNKTYEREQEKKDLNKIIWRKQILHFLLYSLNEWYSQINWSATGSMLGAIGTCIAAFFAIVIAKRQNDLTKKIADKQFEQAKLEMKITLYEKRFVCYQLLKKYLYIGNIFKHKQKEIPADIQQQIIESVYYSNEADRESLANEIRSLYGYLSDSQNSAMAHG